MLNWELLLAKVTQVWKHEQLNHKRLSHFGRAKASYLRTGESQSRIRVRLVSNKSLKCPFK